MRTKSVVALMPGDLIIHDGTARLGKPIDIKSVALDGMRFPRPKDEKSPNVVPMNGENVIVNDTLVFHKSWEVTVK